MKKLTGKLKNGVVVLDEPVDLPEGTEVVVEVNEPVGARDWLLSFAGIWQDDPDIEAWYRAWPNSRSVSEGFKL